MYEGIPTGKPKKDKESWAPKHKAVFGEEPHSIDDAVFKNQRSEEEVAEEARRIEGTAPAPIHESVFGKERRVEAPLHEKVFGAGDSSFEEGDEFDDVEGVMKLRDAFANGSFTNAPAEELFHKGKLTIDTYREVLREALDKYDEILIPALDAFEGLEQKEAELANMETVRRALADEVLLKQQYDALVKSFRVGEKKVA